MGEEVTAPGDDCEAERGGCGGVLPAKVGAQSAGFRNQGSPQI